MANGKEALNGSQNGSRTPENGGLSNGNGENRFRSFNLTPANGRARAAEQSGDLISTARNGEVSNIDGTEQVEAKVVSPEEQIHYYEQIIRFMQAELVSLAQDFETIFHYLAELKENFDPDLEVRNNVLAVLEYYQQSNYPDLKNLIGRMNLYAGEFVIYDSKELLIPSKLLKFIELLHGYRINLTYQLLEYTQIVKRLNEGSEPTLSDEIKNYLVMMSKWTHSKDTALLENLRRSLSK